MFMMFGLPAETNEANDCVRFIKIGDNPLLTYDRGKTAFDYAMDNQSKEALDVLSKLR